MSYCFYLYQYDRLSLLVTVKSEKRATNITQLMMTATATIEKHGVSTRRLQPLTRQTILLKYKIYFNIL